MPTKLSYTNTYRVTIFIRWYNKSEIGTFSDSPTNFSAAKVYTSNRNSSVKLTFPAIGARNAAGGRVNNRGISPHV